MMPSLEDRLMMRRPSSDRGPPVRAPLAAAAIGSSAPPKRDRFAYRATLEADAFRPREGPGSDQVFGSSLPINAASSVRFRVPNLARMLETWRSTVLRERKSTRPISGFDSP